MEQLPPEKIQKLLKEVIEHFDQEDRSVRERQIREARKLKFYWDGFTDIWWSDTAHDWRVWNQEATSESYGDAAYYDKRANIFKAYLESIIAAMSASIPGIKCYPDDADSPLDLTTAKAGERIAELLKRHNDTDLLWLHALFIYCTEGMVAGFNYVKTDKKYGTYEKKEYKDDKVEAYVCPECQGQLDESLFSSPEQLTLDVLEGTEPNPIECPHCGGELDPALEKTTLLIPKLVGVTQEPKSRVCMEAHGLLFVKTATYAQKQEDTPYLIYSYETHYSNVRARYKHLANKFNQGKFGPGSGGVYDPYERWGRLPTQYHGDYPVNTITVRNAWLRPEAFYVLKEEDAEELIKEYPKGAYVVLINDDFAEACEEELDARWTLTKNPLSDYIHTQPHGSSLVSIQDITNEIISLVLQTIEHGIPQTFANPNVLNFDQYNQTEVAPGMIFPAVPQGGKTMSDAFYEVKTATLSQEVLPFSQLVQQLGQTASGALPALFGGDNVGGGKTAAEYSMSKNQAMQRLQNPWKMFTTWWKEMFAKAIPAFMEVMQEDEKFVRKDPNGNFINVFIRKSELEGKIGSIEVDAAENLPTSWLQKKDLLMQFLQAANPVVMEALVSADNLPVLAETVGLANLTLPGEDDRSKQFEEINQLINSTPYTVPPEMMSPEQMMMGEEIEQPSVSIEPDVDNHAVHIQICKAWAVSDAGRVTKVENPEGYKNVLLHLKEHINYTQMMMMTQAPMPEEGNEGKPPQNDKSAAPIKGQANVS